MKRKFTFLLMALLALTSFRSWGQTQTRTAYHGASPSKDVKTEAVLSAVKAPANVASSDRAVRGDSQLTYCSSTTFSSAIGLNNTTTYLEWAAAFRPSMFTANDNYITSVDFYAFQAGNYTLKIYDGDAAASVPTNAIYEHNYNITTPGTWVNLEVVNQIVAIDHTKALWVAIGNTDALHPAAYTSEVLSTTDCCMMYLQGEWQPITDLGPFQIQPWMIVANTTSDNPGIQCEAISTFPYFNDFEDFVSNHDCWVSIDNDGDGQDWITGTTQSGAFNGYNSSTGLVSKSYDYNGSSVSYDADNYLLSPEFELPAGYIVTLSWYAKSLYSGAPDWYEVMIAPNGSTEINDFVQIFGEDGPADWAQRTADISAYAGTTVRVVFHHQDAEQYWILIDNLGIETAFDCDPTITEFPYFNDFENFLNEKDCWIDIDNDGDGYGWFTDTEANWGTGLGVNNSNCLVSQSFENYVGARDADNYLLSPEFVLPAGKFVTLSWYERSQDAGYPDWYEVMVAPNGSTEISDFVSIYNGVAANPWTERTADLTEYAGTTVRVVFHHQSEDRYILNIDNVKVEVKLVYNITYDSNIQHGSITGPATAYAGQTVTLSATPATGYELGAWIVTNVSTSETIDVVNNQFVMPESDVTVSARFVRGFTVDFERGIPFGWTTIDADGDGYNWITGINVGHNSSNYVCSQSYDDYVGALTPDNYLVSPLVQLGGSISFWACAQDASYPEEHFGVAVSTGSNTDAADFTTISEWTMTAKGGNRQSGERGTRSQGTWYQYTVDLSEYSGRGYVAIRHFNCTDQYILNVDDINMCFTDETDYYSISYPEQEHVSVSGISEAFAGQTVYLSPIVDEGYVLDELIVKNANTQETITVFDNQFVMPFDNVMISVSFHERQPYAVNIADGITGGTVTADPCIDVLEGTTVTLSATPATGYEFGAWIVTNVTTSEPIAVVNNQFIMPESNVTVTATFIPVFPLTVYDGTNTSMYTAVYAYYGDTQNSAAQFVIPASQLEAMAGCTISSLKFYVDPSQNSRLEYLEGPTYAGYIMEVEETTMSNFIDFGAATNMFNGHVSLTNSNSELVINFAEPFTYNGGNLAIAFKCIESVSYTQLYYFGTTVTGGSIYRNNATASATANNFIPKTTFYYSNPNLHGITLNQPEGGEIAASAGAALPGDVITLTLVQAPLGYEFGEWIVKDAEDNTITVTDNTFVMPASDVTVTATFNEVTQYNITFATLEGGTIHAEYNNTTITKAPAGTTVTLAVALNTGYGLDQFIVDSEAIDGNTFVMPAHDVEVSATFVPALTVYDGTVTNQYTAVYTFYGDTDNSAAQFVVPAEQLTAMVGGEISSIKFYVNPNNIFNLQNLGGPSYAGYITEVTETTMSNFIDFGTATTVFTGHVSLSNNNSELVIDFSAPYTYNGGNLAIAFECTASSGYTTLNYYGTTVSGGGIYRNSGTEATINNNFIPKTTFLYTPVTPYTVNLHVNGVVSEEEVSSLPTPENIPAGMTFCGWTNSDIATYTTEAPSYVTKATADGEDFYAVFSYTEEEQTRGQNWVKITSPSELVDGEEIVLIYNDSYVMGQRSSFGTNYNRYAVEVVDGRIASMPSEANVFTLSGTSGNWKLNYSDSEVGNTTLSYNTNDCLAYYGLWQSHGCDSYDVWTAEGTSKVIFKNNYKNEYIGEDESVYAELIHSVANANLACEAYKKDVATTTYYMTEAITNGEVTATTTAKNIIITTETVTVNNDIVLTMAENGLFRNEDAANFVFEEGAQFYYDGAETVNATFEKNITGTEWYTISSPLANSVEFAEVENLIPTYVEVDNYDLYRLNEAEGKWENARVNEGVAFTTIDKGLGYLYANATEIDHIAFAGEINVAPAECTLTNSATNGFNLIGNPFTQNITLANVTGTAELADGFYVLNNDESWGTEPSFGTIAPLQGFLVQATTAGTVTISKPTAAPSKGERSEQSTNIEMIVSNSNHRDNAYAVFGEGIGLNKINHRNAQAPMLYVPQDGEDFAIAFMDENTTVFPLNFKAMTTGNYSISLKPTDDINTLVLIDNMTGVETNMLLEGSYSFNGSPADSDGRFTVKLSISHNNGQADSEHFVYQNGSELVVNGEGTLQIFDVLGRVVISEEVHGQTVNVGGLTTGAYIVRMTGNEVKTQKIIIR